MISVVSNDQTVQEQGNNLNLLRVAIGSVWKLIIRYMQKIEWYLCATSIYTAEFSKLSNTVTVWYKIIKPNYSFVCWGFNIPHGDARQIVKRLDTHNVCM